MKKPSQPLLLFLLPLLITLHINGQNIEGKTTKPKPPLTGFIQNEGQIIDQNNNLNPEVKFLFNQPGLNIQLKNNSFSYDAYTVKIIDKPKNDDAIEKIKSIHPSEIKYKFHRIDVKFIGANTSPLIIPEDQGNDYLKCANQTHIHTHTDHDENAFTSY